MGKYDHIKQLRQYYKLVERDIFLITRRENDYAIKSTPVSRAEGIVL